MIKAIVAALFYGSAVVAGDTESEGDLRVLTDAEFNTLVASLPSHPRVPEEAESNDPFRRLSKGDLDLLSDIFKVSAGGALFDIIDRATLSGYSTGPNAAFSNLAQLTAWYNSQSTAFKARYGLLAPPTPLVDLYLLSSPGLPVGSFRYQSIGGVTFRETSRISQVFTEPYPTCVPSRTFVFPPVTVPTPPPFLTGLTLVRSAFTFIPAGSTVKVLTDPFGNKYYQGSARSALPATLPGGYSIAPETLDRDFRSFCIGGDFGFEQKIEIENGQVESSSLVCKQINFCDNLGNCYLPLNFAHPEHFNDAAQIAGPGGFNCATFNLGGGK
jgi:hypothetical protein